jgi:hypothetical protein
VWRSPPSTCRSRGRFILLRSPAFALFVYRPLISKAWAHSWPRSPWLTTSPNRPSFLRRRDADNFSCAWQFGVDGCLRVWWGRVQWTGKRWRRWRRRRRRWRRWDLSRQHDLHDLSLVFADEPDSGRQYCGDMDQRFRRGAQCHVLHALGSSRCIRRGFGELFGSFAKHKPTPVRRRWFLFLYLHDPRSRDERFCGSAVAVAWLEERHSVERLRRGDAERRQGARHHIDGTSRLA